ncbi:MAG TPA: hypothetical protein VK203_27240 [Nostocaceae cyanobacterium]|nr:hypothetical protein [Nostocaceae cyanobacterium]
MSILERIPFFSLALMLMSYSTLGWMISEAKAPLFIWTIAVVSILLLLVSLTVPLSKLNEYSTTLFKSNTRTFGVTILAAFLFFVMLSWFRVFLDTLLIISATILVKIDFQAARFRASLAFCLTSTCSLVGLATGAFIYRLVHNFIS